MQYTYTLLAPGEYNAPFIEFTGRKYHHLVRVRRVQVGTPLHAAYQDGRVLVAEVSEITPDTLRARVIGEAFASGQSPCRITLYQAVLKGEKMDLVTQKACELGATTLVPLMAKRSIPRWTPSQAIDRAERWQRIAEAAAEQCERSVPMLVESPCTLKEAIAGALGVRVLLHERQGRSLRQLAAQIPTTPEIALFIGPEGGWDREESDALLASNAVPIHLGNRILRAETASITAVALAQYLWGDLGSFEA